MKMRSVCCDRGIGHSRDHASSATNRKCFGTYNRSVYRGKTGDAVWVRWIYEK